jgi:hypothetical protein
MVSSHGEESGNASKGNIDSCLERPLLLEKEAGKGLEEWKEERKR